MKERGTEGEGKKCLLVSKGFSQDVRGSRKTGREKARQEDMAEGEGEEREKLERKL